MRIALASSWLGCLLCLGSCCSLSRLFCGPDRSPWISERYETPRQTVQTLFEALRRDDPDTLAKCLSLPYRRRLGVGDTLVLRLLWERFREENPYLHVAGYTDVPEPSRRGADHATVALEVAGEPIEIDLSRETVWEVRYSLPDRPAGDLSGTLPSLGARAQIASISDDFDDKSRIMLAPFEFPHTGTAAMPLEAIDHVGLTRRWTISDIRQRR